MYPSFANVQNLHPKIPLLQPSINPNTRRLAAGEAVSPRTGRGCFPGLEVEGFFSTAASQRNPSNEATEQPSNPESPEARWSRWRAEADAVPDPGPTIRFVLPDGLTREMILEQFKDLPE